MYSEFYTDVYKIYPNVAQSYEDTPTIESLEDLTGEEVLDWIKKKSIGNGQFCKANIIDHIIDNEEVFIALKKKDSYQFFCPLDKLIDFINENI